MDSDSGSAILENRDRLRYGLNNEIEDESRLVLGIVAIEMSSLDSGSTKNLGSSVSSLDLESPLGTKMADLAEVRSEPRTECAAAPKNRSRGITRFGNQNV